MNFCPGSKNSIIGKTTRYDRIIKELCHFYKVSLIKTGLMFHIEKKQHSSRVENIYVKTSFNIPLTAALL
jgi:hypothetical protein